MQEELDALAQSYLGYCSVPFLYQADRMQVDLLLQT